MKTHNTSGAGESPIAEFTPGPWYLGIRQPNSGKFIYGNGGSEIADCDMLTNLDAENLANASLIAAAPELLEALQKLVFETSHLVHGKGDNPQHVYNELHNALAVITKATGQA